MKWYSFLGISAAIFFILSSSTYALEVMSWVPPYDISKCYSRLTEDMGTYSAHDVMTALGLQFWRPTSSGGLVYEVECDDDEVIKFRTKCKEYGIKLLLCVYNNNQQNPGWDWNLARSAFRSNKTNFVNSLYDECKRLDLDGVDIDLEGTSEHDDDREAFAEFVNELGEKLHADKLILTVDSFHSPCYNAPNMAWWKDWIGNVDYVHSMGYSQLYENNNSTLSGCPSDPDEEGEKFFKYSYQSQYPLDQGCPETMCSIGMPSSSSWGGGYVRDHMQDILDLPSPTGICIWDFTLGGSHWQESATWELANEIADMWPTPIVVMDNAGVQQQNPVTVKVTQNYIRLEVEQKGQYTLSLFDASGRLNRTLGAKHYTSGVHTLPLTEDKVASGIYFLTVKGEGQSFSQKVVIGH